MTATPAPSPAALVKKYDALRARFNALDSTLTDKLVREHFLAPIRQLLDNTKDHAFPNAQSREHAGTHQMWLRDAELFLGMAEVQLDYVDKIVARYGPGFTLAG